MKHIKLFEHFSGTGMSMGSGSGDAMLFGALTPPGGHGAHPVFFTKSTMDSVGFTKDERIGWWYDPNKEDGVVIMEIQPIEGNPSMVLIASFADDPYFSIAQPSPAELNDLGDFIEEETPEYEMAMGLTDTQGMDELVFEVVPFPGNNVILWSNTPDSGNGHWDGTEDVIDLTDYIKENE